MRYLRYLLFPILGFALVASSGCMSRSKKNYATSVVRVYLEATNASEVGGVVRLPVSGVSINIEPRAHFTEYDIEGCEVIANELGQGLAFRLTSAAARDLYKLSVPNQGKRLVTMVNNVPIGARRIDGAFSQGYLVTYVELPDADLEKLAKDIVRTSKDLRDELERKQK